MVSMPTPCPELAAACPARFFDGSSSQPQAVWLRLDGTTLSISRAEDDAAAGRSLDIASLDPSERWRNGVLAVALPDGGTLWLDRSADVIASALLDRQRRPWSAMRLIESWTAVAACLIALVALLVWFDRQGAGLAAQAALLAVPRSVDHAVGEKAMEAIDGSWLRPSRVPRPRIAHVNERFVGLAAKVAPDLPVRVEFRSAAQGPGFNALALPHGMLVVLDGMAESMTDDELIAVLGHELGHVVHRHGMRQAVRGFGLVAVAGVLLSDFSSVAATAADTLQDLHYSREDERQADAYAREFLAAAGLPASVLDSVWRKIQARERAGGDRGLPEWLSTHPPTEERLGKPEGP